MKVRKLYELKLPPYHFKVGKTIYLRGSPYKVIYIKEITINEDIFGLKETTYAIKLRNLNNGHEFEINDKHIENGL